MLDNVQEIKADYKFELRVEGIIVNQFPPRANRPQRMVHEQLD